MQKIFITATGTGIGKTLVTTALCHQLINAGKKIVALKPVISGFTDGDMESDTALILQSCNLPVSSENIEAISPWRFSRPLSPNMAAQAENKNILLDEVVDFCRNYESCGADILLVEGVGGVCVPLNNKYTVLDWMAELQDWKIILVAGSYLGSISHTLTAVQAMAARNLKPNKVIISESGDNAVPMAEVIQTLKNFFPESVSIANVSRIKINEDQKIWEKVPKLDGVYL